LKIAAITVLKLEGKLGGGSYSQTDQLEREISLLKAQA
jgi:hypothetical protein